MVFACEQQARVFEDLTEELQSEEALKASLDLIDLRDRAGWTGANENAAWIQAKQLALIADATLERPGTKIREINSAGTCLIIGKDDSVLPFAETLGQELAVTCVLGVAPKRVNPSTSYDLAVGQLRSLSGGSRSVRRDLRELLDTGRNRAWGDPVHNPERRGYFSM